MSDSLHRPPSPSLRASDGERARHVEILTEHAAQGRLSMDELSDRVERAQSARTRGELDDLVRDLPALRVVESDRTARAADGRRELRRHVVAYALVNLLLVGIWLAAGAGYFWPIWPILGWGLGIASHASETFTGRALPMARCGHHRPRTRRLTA